MKCDKCSNYQPCPSGTDDGYYKACKSLSELSIGLSKLTNEDIQEVMDGKKNYCKRFEKI